MDYSNYNAILKFKNIEVAMLAMLKNEDIGLIFSEFIPIMKNHFLTNYDKLINVVDKEIEQQIINNTDTNIITTTIYQMNVRLNYKELKKKIIRCFDVIKSFNI
jgi:hypothetical protein